MYLMYADESGNTGTDYDNKEQPIFSLVGVVIEDKKWHEINDYFEEEKIKICPEFKDNEIHSSELFNAPKSSIFNKYSWQENLQTLEKIVDLIVSLPIEIYSTYIFKPDFKKYILQTLGPNIKVDPYLYAFALNYNNFNMDLKQKNSLGIVFSDELKNITNSIELLYPKLVSNNKNIIEKSLYIDSKKNNFIQIADVIALYSNKYICITNDLARYNPIKEEHCIKMYEKITDFCGNHKENEIDKNKRIYIDNLFK